MTSINSISGFSQAMGIPQKTNFKPVEKVDVNIHYKDEQGQDQLMTLDEYNSQRGSDKFKTYKPTHISVISPDTQTNTTMAISDLKKSSIKTAMQEAFNTLEISPNTPEVVSFLKASASSIISNIRSGKSDDTNDLELFTEKAKKRLPKKAENNPLRREFWDKKLTALHNHQKALQHYDLSAQKKVVELYFKIEKVLKEASKTNGGSLTSQQAIKLQEYDNEANKIAGQAHSTEAERLADKSEALSVAITVAEFTRDAAQNTVNGVADAVPALKPLAVGLDASLAFIDSVGKGESLGSAALQASISGVLSAIGPGVNASFKKELAFMLGKVIAKSTADLAMAYQKGEKIDSAEFTSKMVDTILMNLAEMGLEKKYGIEIDTSSKGALKGALQTFAGMIQSTFLSTANLFKD